MKLRKRSGSSTMMYATANTGATTGRNTPHKPAPQIKKRESKKLNANQPVSEHYGAEEALLDEEMEKARAFMKR